MSESTEIIRQVSALSYLGVFGISFLANVIVPVPEEIVILAIGYVVGMGRLNFWITLPVVVAGALLSDIGMYSLSFYGNKIVNWFYNKFFARLLPPNPQFFDQHLNKVVFMSRFLVQLRFLGPFFAGRMKMKFKKFLMLDISALIVYVTVLLWAGHYFANRIDQIFDGIGAFKNILLILLGVFILWTIGQTVKKVLLGDWAFGKKPADEKYHKTWMPGVWKVKK